MNCNSCPRKCNIERNDNAGHGFCKSGTLPVVAKAFLHKWEEPCISGTNGSGNIFFSGCNLKCCYCQNYDISGTGANKNIKGKQITPERLSQIFDELIAKGAHCINLVTPTHYTESILDALNIHGNLDIPLVYNSSGYDSIDALESLKDKIDIYMPDMKYALCDVAEKYSHAKNYPDIAKSAILKMFNHIGPYEYGKDGLLKKGIIIRHLILPGNLKNTFAVIDWVNETFNPGDILFSLMSQYTPCNSSEYKELNRKITSYEYDKAVDYLYNTNISDIFLQELTSADEKYIPCFDCEGI